MNSSTPAPLVLAQAASNVTATVLETDIRDDMVRVQLPDGDIRIVTMSRMVSAPARQPISATIIELDARDDTVRVRLADGSTRNVLIAEQDIARLSLRRGSEVTLGIDNGLVVTMFMGDTSAPVTEIQ